MMSKKNYEEIASILHDQFRASDEPGAISTVGALVDKFSTAFKAENSSFDEDKFKSAVYEPREEAPIKAV